MSTVPSLARTEKVKGTCDLSLMDLSWDRIHRTSVILGRFRTSLGFSFLYKTGVIINNTYSQ